MSKILIQHTLLPDGQRRDILIEGNRIARIGSVSAEEHPDADLIDGSYLATIPGMVNGHCHAAMTLFRGYGDDLDLMDWLHHMIWPVEAHMTEEHIYAGARLACLEMLKGGTTSFLDMYTLPEATARAAEETGIRANVSYTLFDQGSAVRAQQDRERLDYYLDYFTRFSDRISLSVGPHAIYTVSGEQLQYAHRFAQEHGQLLHLHMAETRAEWEQCRIEHGTTPVRYAHHLGILSPATVLPHTLWVDSEEVQIIADSGAAVVHNPASNMKLASGLAFRFAEMHAKGVRVGIGTDGVSSSNNLDHFTAMRLASFLAKAWSGDPKAVPAGMVYEAATRVGADILGIDAGRIEEGAIADLALIDLSHPEMTPCHNLVSNLVYAASGHCVDTTIVDGRIVMRHRIVPCEQEIREAALDACRDLYARAGKECHV